MEQIDMQFHKSEDCWLSRSERDIML